METKNLGELFREAKKGQPVDTSHRKNVKQTKEKKKYNYARGFRKSGIFGVSKVKGWSTNVLHCYKYSYTKEDGRKTSLQRKKLIDLYEAVREKGHDFYVTDMKKARNFVDNNCESNEEYNYIMNNVQIVKGDD